MATRAPTANRSAAASARKTAATKAPTQYIFEWEGKDRKGKIFKGEMRAESITEVNAVLRKQGCRSPSPSVGAPRAARRSYPRTSPTSRASCRPC